MFLGIELEQPEPTKNDEIENGALLRKRQSDRERPKNPEIGDEAVLAKQTGNDKLANDETVTKADSASLNTRSGIPLLKS